MFTEFFKCLNWCFSSYLGYIWPLFLFCLFVSLFLLLPSLFPPPLPLLSPETPITHTLDLLILFHVSKLNFFQFSPSLCCSGWIISVVNLQFIGSFLCYLLYVIRVNFYFRCQIFKFYSFIMFILKMILIFQPIYKSCLNSLFANSNIWVNSGLVFIDYLFSWESHFSWDNE